MKSFHFPRKSLWIKLRYRLLRYTANVIFSVRILLKWILIGLLTGVVVGCVSTLFSYLLTYVNDFRTARPLIVLTLPAGGLLIVFLYRFFKDDDDTGTNMIISSIHSSTDIPVKMAPLIFITTLTTHLCGGSTGREGAAIQLGGSIANRLGKILRLSKNDRHIIIMCGMSAGFSALFGTPMAAAIFSLEVISVGIMHYSALVPCITASYTALFIAQYFGLSAETFTVSIIPEFTPVLLLKMILLGAVLGAVSVLVCIILHTAEHLYKKYFKSPYIRICIAGCLIIALSAILRTQMYLGSGISIIEKIFEEGHIVPYAFLLKILFTALTLGAGFKGGEIVPSFCIGAALGCTLASLFGLPTQLAAACGMAGVFCGVTNCPITTLLISFEMFGFEGMPYYLVTIAVSYMLSGYYGLYHAQKIMYSKTETHYINETTH